MGVPLLINFHCGCSLIILTFTGTGLGPEERGLVEAAYKSGAVSILTATSTLAAGVNLPARRVIFRCRALVNTRPSGSAHTLPPVSSLQQPLLLDFAIMSASVWQCTRRPRHLQRNDTWLQQT